MLTGLLTALLLLPAQASAEKYFLHDAGDFAPAGRHVEFADRFGWSSYSVDFNFGIDHAAGSFSRNSKLTLKIAKRDGKAWTYVCKANGALPMTATTNIIYGKGISVMADCPIAKKDFAKAVGLESKSVGRPSLVFQVMIQDGQVLPGAQRGLYFQAGGDESPEMRAYSADSDPTSLAVVFHSR